MITENIVLELTLIVTMKMFVLCVMASTLTKIDQMLTGFKVAVIGP